MRVEMVGSEPHEFLRQIPTHQLAATVRHCARAGESRAAGGRVSFSLGSFSAAVFVLAGKCRHRNSQRRENAVRLRRSNGIFGKPPRNQSGIAPENPRFDCRSPEVRGSGNAGQVRCHPGPAAAIAEQSCFAMGFETVSDSVLLLSLRHVHLCSRRVCRGAFWRRNESWRRLPECAR